MKVLKLFLFLTGVSSRLRNFCIYADCSYCHKQLANGAFRPISAAARFCKLLLITKLLPQTIEAQTRVPQTGRRCPRTVRRPRRPRSSGTEDEQNYVEDEDEDGTRTKRKRSWRTSEDEDEVEDELVLGRPRGRGRPHLWSNEDEDEVKDELVLGDG